MDPELRTETLHALIARYRSGEVRALDDLIRRTADRLTHLASAMLRTYPAVRARADTGDVLQSALIRLMRALAAVTPESVRDYYRLAAELIRRELRDLARWHGRRPAGGDPVEAVPDPGLARDLELWAQLQEEVEGLPADLREVFCLTFYHGWAQAQIADLLQVSDRQVRRLWGRACRRLGTALGGELPGG